MAPDQAFANSLVEQIRKILLDLPQELTLNSFKSEKLFDQVDIDLGYGRSLVLSLWGKKL